MFGTLIMGAVAVGASFLMPKPKTDSSNSDVQLPEMPKVTAGSPLPEVYGVGRVGGSFIYSTEPRRVTDSITTSVGKGGSQTQEESYVVVDLMGFALACNEPVNLEELYLNGELVYAPNSPDPAIVDKGNKFLSRHITFFSGTDTQEASSELIASTGDPNVPRFRKMSYILLRDLKLGNYGNTYPAVTAVLRSQNFYRNIRDFLDKIIDNSGVNQFSQEFYGIDTLTTAERLEDVPFAGTIIQQDGNNYLDHIEPIMNFWQIVKKENPDGTRILDFEIDTTQQTQVVTTIPGNDLLGVDGEAAFEITDVSSDKIPNEFIVRFLNKTRNYDNDTVQAIVSKGRVGNSSRYDLPYVLNKSQAMTGCQRLLRDAWVRKQSLKFTLPTLYDALIRQGTLLKFTDQVLLEGKLWYVADVSIGDRGMSEYLCYPVNPVTTVYASNIADSPANPPSTDSIPNAQELLASKIADVNLIESSTQRQSPYVGFDIPNYTGSASLYTSSDNVNFNFLATLTDLQPVGTLVTPMTNSEPFIARRNDSIRVRFSNDNTTLTSVTEEESFQMARLISVNKEIIAYREAVQVDDNTWDLFGIIRGVYDSEAFINGHQADSPVMILRELDSEATRLSALGLADRGSLYYKVTTEADPVLSDIETQFLSYESNTAKALAPLVYNPNRQVNNDWLIQWEARTVNRAAYFIEDNVARPLNPDGNTFEVLIYTADGTILLRTVVVTGTTFTYTEAQQINDGGIRDNISITVFQQSQEASAGRGYEGTTFN